jgi:hypothetical protein
MVRLAIGDWVRLIRLFRGCRYGKVLSIDRVSVIVGLDCDTKHGGGLRCMRDEVARITNQVAPHRYFPMSKRLPYGEYHCADGTRVLHNRDYEPMFRISPDGSYSPCDPGEEIDVESENNFYVSGNGPWENRAVFDMCVEKLPVAERVC